MPDSALRRTLTWVFQWPATPYVILNGAIDASELQAYVAGLDGVTVHHVTTAAIARVLHEFPEANARVVGDHIVPFDHVGVSMPVNLLGHDGGGRQSLGFAVVSDVDKMNLREVAAACSSTVGKERSGKPANPAVRTLWRVAEHTPQRLLNRTLDAALRIVHTRGASDALFARFPASTFLSNPGAVLAGDGKPGMLFRGVSLFVPQRMALVGTVWALSLIQDEVIPVDGVPAVRPMLPVVFAFDHRIVDGVIGGRMMQRFGTILTEPAAHFGADGTRAIAS